MHFFQCKHRPRRSWPQRGWLSGWVSVWFSVVGPPSVSTAVANMVTNDTKDCTACCLMGKTTTTPAATTSPHIAAPSQFIDLTLQGTFQCVRKMIRKYTPLAKGGGGGGRRLILARLITSAFRELYRHCSGEDGQSKSHFQLIVETWPAGRAHSLFGGWGRPKSELTRPTRYPTK